MKTPLRIALAASSSTVVTVVILLSVAGFSLYFQGDPLDRNELETAIGPAMTVLLISAFLVMVPTFLLLRYKGVTNIWAAIVAGVIASYAGNLYFNWPHYGPEYAGNYSSVERNGEMVATIVDGHMTLAGWIDVLGQVTIGGILSGIVLGSFFWLVWRITRPAK